MRQDFRRPLRGAICGWGFIASNGHFPAYTADPRDYRIDVVCDPCEARLRHARSSIPGVRVYSDHVRMLEREYQHLDFIDVCTPPSEHAAIALAALDRGLHVLCEKPLATRVDDARLMVAAARAQSRVLYPCHNYKYAPVLGAVRRLLAAGEIGRLHLATLQTFRTSHARGVEQWRPDWRRERRWSGGGIGMDHGSHTFYLTFDWFGAYPTAITAKTFTTGKHDTEDNLSCTLTFPHGRAVVHLSWTAGIRRVIYTLHGELGAIHVEDDELEIAVRHGPERAPIWERRRETFASNWMDAGHAEWFRSLLRGFARAIDERSFATKDAFDAVRCVELIGRAYASASQESRELGFGGTP